MTVLKKIASVFIILFITTEVFAAQEKKIVFAISPMASPVTTMSGYGDFINYISKKTGMKVLLKQRRKYAEINELLKSGEAQFALTCTGAFLSGKYDFGLELLAVPVVDGETSYNSYIIVHQESGIKSFDELKGKVFAFTDPLSLSGRLYPLYLLNQLKSKPETFFEKTFYTSSHEKSIESVAYGFADGAAVDSLIFKNMKINGSPVINGLKIIKVSPRYGVPPIVVSPRVDKEIKQTMRHVLQMMAENPARMVILDPIGMEEFILPNPANYYNAVQLRKAALAK